MRKNSYYKYWWTPILIYAVIYFFIGMLLKAETLKSSIAIFIGVILAIVILDIIWGIIDLIFRQILKHRNPNEPLDMMTIRFDFEIECPTCLASEIKDTIVLSTNDSIKKMVKKYHIEDCFHVNHHASVKSIPEDDNSTDTPDETDTTDASDTSDTTDAQN